MRLLGMSPRPEFLADAVSKGASILLMCADADWRRCHRRHVAAQLARMTGTEVVHL